MADEIVVKLKVDNSGAVQVIDQTTDAVDDTNEAIKETGSSVGDLTDQLDKMTGGAVSLFKGMLDGIKKAVGGFKTLKVALASTGIGLLVVAFGSLVAFFTKTARGAEELRVITAGLQQVFDEISDVVVSIGEGLFNAFSNPREALKSFGEAIKENLFNRIKAVGEIVGNLSSAFQKLFTGDFSGAAEEALGLFDNMGQLITGIEDPISKLTEGTKNFVNEVVEGVQQATALERAMNAVLRAERELRVERAESRKEIIQQRFIAEDITRSFEERRAAAAKALELEQKLVDESLRIARERLRIEEAQANLAESDEETLERLADLRAEVANLEAESLERQITSRNLLNQIDREEASRKEQERAKQLADEEALEKARMDALKRIQQAQLTQDELEIANVNSKYDELVRLAEKYGQDTIILEQRRTDALNAITEKRAAAEQKKADFEVQVETEKQRAKVGIAVQALGAIAAIAGEESAFAKAAAIADTAWSTFQASMAAYASGAKINPIFGAIAAATAVATGIASIAKIVSTPEPKPPKVPSLGKLGGGGSTGGGGRGSSTSAPSLAGTVNLISPASAQEQLGGEIAEQTNTDQPLQAYVVSENMSDKQQLDRRVRANGTFG